MLEFIIGFSQKAYYAIGPITVRLSFEIIWVRYDIWRRAGGEIAHFPMGER